MLQGDAAKAKVSPTRYACSKAQSLLDRYFDTISQTRTHGLWFRLEWVMSIA